MVATTRNATNRFITVFTHPFLQTWSRSAHGTCHGNDTGWVEKEFSHCQFGEGGSLAELYGGTYSLLWKYMTRGTDVKRRFRSVTGSGRDRSGSAAESDGEGRSDQLCVATFQA